MKPVMIADASLPIALADWMRTTCLPFWATKAISPANGLAYESLNADQTPTTGANLRVRVQFRQIYCFAHAAALGWYPDGARLALNLWQRVNETCRPQDGAPGFVHVLAPDLAVIDGRRDSYDHAFAVLALSWLARASGDAQVRAALEDTLAFVDAQMTDSLGFLTEGVPASLPRRQNPQMHWFEAMLALHDAIAHPQGLARANAHLALAQRYMLDTETAIIGEYFNDDWTIASDDMGQHVEPGHIAEWVWLLRAHERLSGAPRGALPTRLLARAESYRNPATGLLPDLADRAGTTLRGTARIWLQTEIAKAWMAEAEAGLPGARDKALNALARLDSLYLKRPFAAGWTDQTDPDGRRKDGPVPTWILYHVLVAVVEADRVLAQPST